MKKKLIPLVGLVVFALQAFGQVGVGTETPTESLDINGTLRIRDLPINGTTNAIFTTGENTSSSTRNQTFTATKMVVLDANGVLGTRPGLPSTSNTKSWTSSGINFGTATGPEATNAMPFTFGPLSVSFYRPGTPVDAFQFHIKSSNTGESYIVDIRNMTTGSANYFRENSTIAQNTWKRIGTTNYTLGTSWHVNVWLKSVNRIYKVTVMSINGSPDTLTVNIQEL